MREIYPAGGNVLAPQFSVADRGRHYFGTLMKSSVGVFLPTNDVADRVHDMRKYQPLHEANLGMKARTQGLERGDTQLVEVSGLIMARAAIKAEKSEFVSDTTTEEVLDMAVEEHVYDPAYPGIVPLMSVPERQDTRRIMDKFYGRILPLFPNRDN